MSQQLSEQEIVRRASLDKLRELGINPYPQALYPVTILSNEIRENFDAFTQMENNLLAKRIKDENDFFESTLQRSLQAAFLGVFFCVGAFFFLSSNIMAGINSLISGITKLKEFKIKVVK